MRKAFRSIGQALTHLLTVDGLDPQLNLSTPTNSYVVTETVLGMPSSRITSKNIPQVDRYGFSCSLHYEIARKDGRAIILLLR